MNDAQRVGLILLAIGIICRISVFEDKHKRERARAARRQRLRDMRSYRSSFIRDMHASDEMWDKSDNVMVVYQLPEGKHRNTQFHDPALAELCGGSVMTKSAVN